VDSPRRTSLAEFSRLYLRAREAASDQASDLSAPTASLEVPENNLAVQVVLGMAKSAEKASRMAAP